MKRRMSIMIKPSIKKRFDKLKIHPREKDEETLTKLMERM